MIFWSVSQALVEIDTQWNVNIKVYAIVCNNSSVEIDTQWNVNLITCDKVKALTSVEIDTQWNVNTKGNKKQAEDYS